MAIWYNLWPFEIVCGHLYYFSQFGMFGPRKIWQPWLTTSPEVGGVFEKNSKLRTGRNNLILSLKFEYSLGLKFRVARWHINKPKILIWVHFGGTCNG
jgi:hypothetical protein